MHKRCHALDARAVPADTTAAPVHRLVAHIWRRLSQPGSFGHLVGGDSLQRQTPQLPNISARSRGRQHPPREHCLACQGNAQLTRLLTVIQRRRRCTPDGTAGSARIAKATAWRPAFRSKWFVEWMGHADEMARQHYLRVNESDLAIAAQTRIDPNLTQLLTQLDISGAPAEEEPETQVYKLLTS